MRKQRDGLMGGGWGLAYTRRMVLGPVIRDRKLQKIWPVVRGDAYFLIFWFLQLIWLHLVEGLSPALGARSNVIVGCSYTRF